MRTKMQETSDGIVSHAYNYLDDKKGKADSIVERSKDVIAGSVSAITSIFEILRNRNSKES
ncbi:hypothetical protein MCHI_000444 [Candidatus Magnetoovum chiemensis]|nr:hypothetical protein MCHI_000444 [Candidatus Magnetoovum chiemensis]